KTRTPGMGITRAQMRIKMRTRTVTPMRVAAAAIKIMRATKIATTRMKVMRAGMRIAVRGVTRTRTKMRIIQGVARTAAPAGVKAEKEIENKLAEATKPPQAFFIACKKS